MPPQPPPDRLLPGSYEPPLRPVEPGESAGVVSFRQAIAVVRRRLQLIVPITAVGAALGLFLASRDPTTYRASAMLRMAGERQTITGQDDDAAPTILGAVFKVIVQQSGDVLGSAVEWAVDLVKIAIGCTHKALTRDTALAW